MKVSLSWLKEYVDITLPIEEIADKLTMAGFEVGSIEIIGGSWDNIVVGQITAVNPHPNADRLTLPTVDLGTEQSTVVCGAPNLRVGDKIAFAKVGAKLVDGHTGKVETLKSAKIRGIASSGMVCSEKELGISDRHEGIMVLPEDAPVSTPLADYLGDVVLDIDITPNRPDCLSVIGIAREIAALTGQKVHIPEVSYKEGTFPIEDNISIEISAPDLCPRYSASLVTGVTIAESPAWMQQRLLACGMRPINNLVDVTNYVMLEYGQPLHSFDYEKIRGKKIIVRRATDYEPVTTLDGNERELDSGMLVITDVMGTVAVAGVMGGANSEVVEETTSILLESANFNAAGIHYTGRTLGIPSEACMRFERGIRPELTMYALKRATQLLVELGGGEAAGGVLDIYPGKKEPEQILLTTDEVKRVLGVSFNLEHMEEILASLGFECEKTGSVTELMVKPPYWRNDISLAVDLIEEIARIDGYNNIPMTMLSQPIPKHEADSIFGLKHKVNQILAGYGFYELVTYSLTSMESLMRLLPEPHPLDSTPLRISNPMTAEQEYLRPNLRANLLTALSLNRRHEDGGMRLFEAGKIYLPQDKDLPDECEVLCGLLSGSGRENSWQNEAKDPDFFEAKGIVEGLLSRLNITARFEKSSDEGFHSTRQAAIVVGSIELGVVGELHPEVVERFTIDEPVYLFEIDLRDLLPYTIVQKMYQAIPRFPAIVRDMALVLDIETKYQQILDIIKSFPLVEKVAIFDVYSGEQVISGKKSLAYRITYQSPTHTLTDRDVNKVQKQIMDRLAKELGATLRS
ncbi:phenylalanine--tRNA ligase subunit beta [Chloroflexota bacterium]